MAVARLRYRFVKTNTENVVAAHPIYFTQYPRVIPNMKNENNIFTENDLSSLNGDF